MIINIIIIIIVILIYIHIYIHFYIKDDNTIKLIEDVSRDNITNNVHNKIPFIFNCEHLNNEIDITECIKENNNYIKTYNSIKLIEPKVKFFVYNTINTNNTFLYYNLHCRTFYKTYDENINLKLIHPKYINNFKLINETNMSTDEKYINYINNSKIFIDVKLKKDQLLFVPNYWIVYYNLNKDQYIEKIQFSTILNKFVFLYNWVNNYNFK